MAKDVHLMQYRPTIVPLEYQDALYVHLMYVIMSLLYIVLGTFGVLRI